MTSQKHKYFAMWFVIIEFMCGGHDFQVQLIYGEIHNEISNTELNANHETLSWLV